MKKKENLRIKGRKVKGKGRNERRKDDKETEKRYGIKEKV